MPGTRTRSVLLRLSPVIAAVLLVGSLLVAVNDAQGSGVPMAPAMLAAPPSGTLPPSSPGTPGPSGTTPNTSPFPPTAPTGLHATSVTAGSVTLGWTASAPGCCPIAGYDITYTQAFNDIVWVESVGNVTTVTLTANIRPATQYSFRVSARDGLGHRSASSNAVTVVTPITDTGPDTVPPAAPANLQAGPVGATSATLTWSPSTDNVAVTGYNVYRFDGLFVSTLLATVAGTTYTTPLSSPRNIFYVRARDAAGNVSIASNTVSVDTSTSPTASPPASPSSSPSAPALSCRVTYTTNSQWVGGFVAGITITNTGTTPIVDWTLTFSFGGDQRITQVWNATFSQSGPAVAMGAATWNRIIAPGASVSVGFQGTWTGSNPLPTAFFINGVPCSLGS